MIPAHEVGGDYYDFLALSGDVVLVMLGDVSGKGIPAALLQSALKTLFRVHASSGTDLDMLAARMSTGLREETGGVPYATAILARFDRAPARIMFVNAVRRGCWFESRRPSRSSRPGCRSVCGRLPGTKRVPSICTPVTWGCS
jgi:hypothetical protein